MCEEELLLLVLAEDSSTRVLADNLLVVGAGCLTDILSRRYHMCHLFYFSLWCKKQYYYKQRQSLLFKTLLIRGGSEKKKPFYVSRREAT